ncbi:hypothetical protein ACJIZ3_008971 [Penstemon smallii]|uniref:TF-B3 domain-containing protein n=1 Tax=Penstemon smallii TaxID=265156 RepID=A0ABD3TCK8_9LAMI
MLTRNSPIQVSNEEEAYNCECTPARPASSSNYKPKESEIIYVDDDDVDDGNNDNPGSLTLTGHNIPKHSTSAPRVYFPAETTRRYNLRKNKMARLKFPQYSQQIWDVQLHKLKDTDRKTPRIALNEGWEEFAIANNLRVGDSVEFQIFKPNDQLNEPNEVIQIDVLYN